jgi:hypothetical protein
LIEYRIAFFSKKKSRIEVASFYYIPGPPLSKQKCFTAPKMNFIERVPKSETARKNKEIKEGRGNHTHAHTNAKTQTQKNTFRRSENKKKKKQAGIKTNKLVLGIIQDESWTTESWTAGGQTTGHEEVSEISFTLQRLCFKAHTG